MSAIKRFQLAIILLILVAQAWSQEAGRTFIRNYPPQEYKASSQNWNVAQDKRGVLYFGNNDGLLEYDGVNWKLIKMPMVRSIAIDSLGCIYVGLDDDFGYIQTDVNSNSHFHSLKDQIPEIYRNFSMMYKIYISGNKVIFTTSKNLFIYQNGKLKRIPILMNYPWTFSVNNRYYVREQGKGLFHFENDSLRFISGSEGFAKMAIIAMLPFGQNEILLATRNNGIYIYAPDKLANFYKPDEFKEVDKFLSKNLVYSGTLLSSGEYAIGTILGGIIVFDAGGKIKNLYDKNSGLQENSVISLYSDKNNQLWAGLDNGISLIQNNLPFSLYTEQNGLKGAPMCLKYFKNKLYVGTNQYLHIQKPDGSFEPIAGTEGQNFQLYESHGTLLLARSSLVEIKDKLALPVENAKAAFMTFCPLKNHPEYLLAGSMNGLYLLEYMNPSWKVKGHLIGFDKSSYMVGEDFQGNTWISNNNELFKLRINTNLDSIISWQKCTPKQGLPSDFGFTFILTSGEVVFGTEKGIFRYRSDKDRFEPHPDFGMLTGKVILFVQEQNGDVWYENILKNGSHEKGILKFRNGKYFSDQTPFNKFSDISCNESPFNICTLPDSTILIGTSSGLLQYNPSIKFDLNHPFPTLIRKVYSKDSLVFGGEGFANTDFRYLKGGEIPYTRNNLIFHFAATYYEDSERNQFSYRLVGSDTTWSAWSIDHKKEYTNLPEGNYTFQVKSKNQYLVTGSMASYSFRILPPFYRTWWAYLGFILMGGVAIYSLVHFRTRQLRERSLTLEKVIEQRTAQIQKQRDNVEQLSRIGKDITSSLSIENIIHTVYQNVNTLMDASVFTIGLYKSDENCIEFASTIEKGVPLPPFSIPLSDENRLATWCFRHQQDVIINDYAADYGKYISQQQAPVAGEHTESIVYLPLWNKEKEIGVISAQAFGKNAYSDYHINMLRNLATYSAIALENADAYRRLAALLDELKATQDRMITQSKLAALGSLTAGIAHEIQNPLNFVNNFSMVSTELLDDMNEEMEKGNIAEVKLIVSDLKQNLEKISHHGKRADAIVKGMMLHSRISADEKQLTDINALLEEAINLTYHGMRAQNDNFEIKIETSFDKSIGKILVIPQELSRAFLNIISNGLYEAHRKKLGNGSNFTPKINICTQRQGNQVEIRIRDNGNGIPESVRDKMFTPFFTTKPAGQGTGLGLSISYNIIVHDHRGQISFETKVGSFTEFLIQFPYNHASNHIENAG